MNPKRNIKDVDVIELACAVCILQVCRNESNIFFNRLYKPGEWSFIFM